MFKTPILFIISHNPEYTQKTFDAIKKIKPKSLFVFSNAPNIKIKAEVKNCQISRNIINQVDWDCDLKTVFRKEKIDHKNFIYDSINSFFKNVKEGLILEDCYEPSESFFPFCQELLEKYRDDKRIMHISGSNYQDGINRSNGSYYFSKDINPCGWATWRQEWNQCAINIENYKVFLKTGEIKNIFSHNAEQFYWLQKFEQTYLGTTDSFEYQWRFTVLSNNALAVIPNNNLINNLKNPQLNKTQKESTSEIKHPWNVLCNVDADFYTFKNVYGIDYSHFNFIKNFILSKKFRKMIL
ncbi:MAG: hypothetical protein WC197_06640 [Candidatus Gastranaerophilaceae bacterium]|jgi:hypothetical protein